MQNQTGLIVVGKTQIDNNLIGELLEASPFYGEFNAQENFWFFPEEPEHYDDLETGLDRLFRLEDITARFEGVWN